ncbi:MAG: hypothetical protein ACYTAF_09390 [Planctomycetota bacterium]|jgi:hypothetical protein
MPENGEPEATPPEKAEPEKKAPPKKFYQKPLFYIVWVALAVFIFLVAFSQNMEKDALIKAGISVFVGLGVSITVFKKGSS